MLCLNTGEYDYLMTRLKFKWERGDFSNYLTAQRVARLIGTHQGLYLIQFITKQHIFLMFLFLKCWEFVSSKYWKMTEQEVKKTCHFKDYQYFQFLKGFCFWKTNFTVEEQLFQARLLTWQTNLFDCFFLYRQRRFLIHRNKFSLPRVLLLRGFVKLQRKREGFFSMTIWNFIIKIYFPI